MSKRPRSRGLLNTTVHPSIVALLFLLVTIVTIAGIHQFRTDIISHYDAIDRIAESRPSFPSPGSIAGINSDTSVDEQAPTQSAEEIPQPPADTRTANPTTPQPNSPPLRGNPEPNPVNPQPAEPEPDTEPDPPGPLLCVVGICL